MKLRDLVGARFERLVIGPPDPAFPLRIAFHQTNVPPVGTHCGTHQLQFTPPYEAGMGGC
jgi:hypothetical protein